MVYGSLLVEKGVFGGETVGNHCMVYSELSNWGPLGAIELLLPMAGERTHEFQI